MVEVAREVETKYDVAPDFAVPTLSRPGREDTIDTVQLTSTYHDTSELDLLRYRLALRRREGDVDTGWQLKVPARRGRTELRWPPSEGLPDELAAQLRPFIRDRTLAEAVRLSVTRVRHRLCDGAGALLAEVALDDVRATGLSIAVRAPRWYEAEIELGPAGQDAVLAEIGAMLTSAGAVPSTSRSKLSRSVLGIGNEGVGTPRTSAGAVLVDYLSRQVDAVVAGHFAILQDTDDEAVHRTRVACRRMRSTLRTFEQCFDAEQAAALEDELRWYAGVLGGVRDAQVLRSRLLAAIDELPADLVVGPITEQVDERLRSDLERHRAELLDAMRSDRYADLLSEASRWRDHPPFTAAAGRPAETLHEAMDRVERTLGKRLRRATRRSGTDEQMHRARKAGKRVRYAAEAAAAAGDDPAHQLAQDITKLQDLLGEFQDSVVAAHLARRLAEVAAEHGEDGFTYGVLVAEQRRHADEARNRARRYRS
ncbi:MAG TPA: CYTH and CHAD domain-containing protein [Jatrophihabitantaceae bacterium]|jgi:CHAD domain-containing protein|nr:CYTH and CHAD domain-containing protein [Jatrophihabitantaceae bacterium]